MISHTEFGKLRLEQLLPEAEIEWVTGWEFMNRLWVGEKSGFSEWLRLEKEPDRLSALAIDFAGFPAAEAAIVFDTLDLPLRPGMDTEELRAVLGEPVEQHLFARDRITYEFAVAGPPEYTLECTVLNEGGLAYLVVMTPLPPEMPA
jgi:hypothetical protein